MAHFHTKIKKGRPYLYVREMGRVDGKVKVISQIYIGSPDRVAQLARSDTPAEEQDVRVEEFGSLWLAAQLDKDIGLVEMINSIVPRSTREDGPSIGEFFLYCVWNRMIESVSKQQMSDWYAGTAIQHIRPVDLSALNSQNYWKKWDRVHEDHLDEMAREFFRRVRAVESPEADCVMFDTTNYYTFMSSATKSELAQRGKNKDGRSHLRQVGLGLLVERRSRLPLFYKTYPGNMHDSRLFAQVMEEMCTAMNDLQGTKQRLTIVVDKGMNSDENFAWIDNHRQLYFVTTYSPHFAEELVSTTLDRFETVDTNKNRQLAEDGEPQEQTLAWRTTGEFWGKERAVVVTWNPASARKQVYTLEGKLDTLREELLLMRAKVRDEAAQWRDADTIRERYVRACENLHLPTCYYDIQFEHSAAKLSMSFCKNTHQIERRKLQMGKNIIVTDNTDWTTAEIVEANLDRWCVENSFRQSKDEDLVGTMPIRHWTDSKIRCHLFTCVVAQTLLRRLELRLAKAGIQRTANDVMNEMRRLHSIVTVNVGSRKVRRRIESPSKTQSAVLLAFGALVDASGGLQLK